MSEVFLTKVERRTIIIQAFFYVLLMFVVSDFMVIGPFWFKLFPWLYFLGLISKSKFSKPYMTLLIVSFTTFISSVLKTGGLNIEVLVITLNSIFMILMGVITGTYLFNLKLSHRLVKFIPKFKKIYMIVASIFITIIVILVNFVINGNIFTYIKANRNLDKYLSKVYNINEYKVEEIKYNIVNFKAQYFYKVKYMENEIIFKYKGDMDFEDINYADRAQSVIVNLRSNLLNYVKQNLKDDIYKLSDNLDVTVEYTKNSVLPNKAKIYITSFSQDEKVYSEIIRQINIINSYYGLSSYEVEYVITQGKNVTNILEEKIKELTVEYLKNSFDINEID